SKDHNLGFNSTSAHGNAVGMNPNKAAHGVVGGYGSVPNQGLKLSQSATIADVSQQIGVPLNTLEDIDNLTKAIDLGKIEVWLDLPSEKHTEVMETIWAIWDAFLIENPNVTSGYSSDLGKSDVVIGESLTSVEGVATFFGVPQKTQVDYENFAKGIERGTYEVWSKLTRKQRKAILKTDHDRREMLYFPERESAGLAVGANNKDQPKVMSNFRHLVAYLVFNGADISIPHKVIEKASFSLSLSLNMGLEAILEGGSVGLIRKAPIILKKWSTDRKLLKEELNRIPIWVKLHDVPLQVFEEDGATPNVVNTFNVVTPTVENDGFQAVGKKKKKKGKRKTSNIAQLFGPSIHQNFRYKPKASTRAPKKVVNVDEEEEEEVEMFC
ncbi:zinc knuckle CX2CX4HX4C containing protein, partial [Tanacetum coccineum]